MEGEVLIVGLVVAIPFVLLTWIGTVVLGLRDVTVNLKLGFVPGMAVTLIQYPAEFIGRKLTPAHSADAFLLGYLLLSPICCAAIVLLNSHKTAAHKLTRNRGQTDEITTS